MESKNNKGNLKIILLVAFIVVALVISGFIVYDKFIKEDAPVVNNGVENQPIDGEKEVTVVSAYKFDGKAKYTGTCSDFGAVNMNVNIPKIDSNKANAVALNNKIMKDYGRFANLEKGTVYRNVVVNYTESIKDGIMTIVISANGEFPCGSGVQEKRTYSYDITKDTILDNGTEKPYEDKNQSDNESVVVDFVNIKKNIKYVGTCVVDAKTREVDVKLPMINIDSTNANKLNKMIQNDFNDVILEAKKDETSMAVINAYYNYVIKNDVVYFFVDGENFMGCSSSSSRDKNYFYDIKNDKILSMEDAFKKAGYTLNDLKDAAMKSGYEKYEKLTFEECENISCGECGFQIIEEKLVPYFEPGCA